MRRTSSCDSITDLCDSGTDPEQRRSMTIQLTLIQRLNVKSFFLCVFCLNKNKKRKKKKGLTIDKNIRLIIFVLNALLGDQMVDTGLHLVHLHSRTVDTKHTSRWVLNSSFNELTILSKDISFTFFKSRTMAALICVSVIWVWSSSELDSNFYFQWETERMNTNKESFMQSRLMTPRIISISLFSSLILSANEELKVILELGVIF